MAAANDAPCELSVPAGVPLLLRDLLHERAGLFFEPSRFDLLLDKLQGLVSARGFRSYLDYYYLLKYEDASRSEWLRVMDAFSVQETYFWREQAQIAALANVIVPAWFKRTSLPLRIWSAACASGEEPYSLAIALREAGWGSHPISICGTDASEAALEKARHGVYRERSFRSLPLHLRERYFEWSAEGSRIKRELLPAVSFSRANLVARTEIAEFASAPVIFCRNVFIYFSPEAIRRTVESFADAMPAGGHLFVGASESLLRLTERFEMQEIADAFVYVRQPIPPR